MSRAEQSNALQRTVSYRVPSGTAALAGLHGRDEQSLLALAAVAGAAADEVGVQSHARDAARLGVRFV